MVLGTGNTACFFNPGKGHDNDWKWKILSTEGVGNPVTHTPPTG